MAPVDHVINFQLIVRLTDGLIIDCPRLGLPGCCSDISAWHFHRPSLPLQPGEFGLADKGYQGARELVTPYKGLLGHLNEDFTTFNQVHSAVRIVVEHTNACLTKPSS
ncbi:hypothetical protein Pelo_19814 [Pelomyxa schiedti]|nr:hypothetical protein Pelo_19814 [Pelomyxa schiedti]